MLFHHKYVLIIEYDYLNEIKLYANNGDCSAGREGESIYPLNIEKRGYCFISSLGLQASRVSYYGEVETGRSRLLL